MRAFRLGLCFLAAMSLGRDAWASHRSRRPARPALASSPTRGAVTYVTTTHAFLNRGRVEGLAVGSALGIDRGAKKVGKCVIESVGDHTASCELQTARVGDTFVWRPPADAVQAGSKSKPLPPIPSTQSLQAQRAVVQTATKGLVGFDGEVRTHRRSHFGVFSDARLTDYTWANGSSTFHREQVDIVVRGAPFRWGTRIDIDASAVAWTRRPQYYLSPSKALAVMWVRRASVSANEEGRQLVFSAGRIQPWGAPGLSAVDGALVGYRTPDGAWEAGAFGGAVPEPLTTAPTLTRSALGGYVAGRLQTETMVLFPEARLSYMRAPEYGSRIEAQAKARAAFFRKLDLSADVRFGALGGMPPFAVDLARVEFAYRHSDQLRFDGGARYFGSGTPDIVAIGAAGPSVQSLSADAQFAYNPARAPWLQISGNGLVVRDLQVNLDRYLVGAELAAPSLFGSVLGLAAGYTEEAGWLEGRMPYVQATFNLLRSSLRGMTRVTYVYQHLPQPDGPVTNEVALWLNAEYDILPWLSARAMVLGRMALLPGLEEAVTIFGQVPKGLTMQVGVQAAL